MQRQTSSHKKRKSKKKLKAFAMVNHNDMNIQTNTRDKQCPH